MPPPFAAYLRVYEPLTALPAGEREHWRRYVAGGHAPARREGPRLEYEHCLRRTLAGRLPDPGEQAFVIGGEGVPLICPWRTALRAGRAAEELAGRIGSELSGVLIEGLWPRTIGERAKADLAAWRARHPEARSHIQTSTWSVPMRWFVLFGSDEGDLLLDNGSRELAYRTEMARARRRAARALARLRKGSGDGDGVGDGFGELAITDAVEDLARWLEEFHPRSVVELDYGGLVWLFEPAQLRADRSVADVAAALDAVAAGDAETAGKAHQRITEHWRDAEQAQGAN